MAGRLEKLPSVLFTLSPPSRLRRSNRMYLRRPDRLLQCSRDRQLRQRIDRFHRPNGSFGALQPPASVDVAKNTRASGSSGRELFFLEMADCHCCGVTAEALSEITDRKKLPRLPRIAIRCLSCSRATTEGFFNATMVTMNGSLARRSKQLAFGTRGVP